jgi:hypothetical protein
MSGLFKIVGGELVRIDHFEWEGGPNASGAVFRRTAVLTGLPLATN